MSVLSVCGIGCLVLSVGHDFEPIHILVKLQKLQGDTELPVVVEAGSKLFLDPA